MGGEELALAGLLSLATASVAYTLSETALFSGMRKWAAARNLWAGKLVSCGYCAGHWVAFGLVAIYRPRLFQSWWLLDYFLTALAIAWIASFQWAALTWLVGRTGK